MRICVAVLASFVMLRALTGAASAQQASPSPTPLAGPTATPLTVPLVPAGVVPSTVDVELAGTVTPAFALAHIRAAIDAGTHRLPGTALDIHGITIDANLRPGTSLDALAGVAIAGRGVALDVNGKTNVHVGVAALAPFAPQLLYYSDDPEYVPAGVDGVLLRGTVLPETPARVFLYHVATGTQRRLALVLRTTGTAARVQLVSAAVGPSPSYAYVGQQTSARFLVAQALQQSVVLDLAPDVPLELPFGTLQPGDLIEAIADLRIVTGGTVTFSVVTAASDASLGTLFDGPEIADDSHDRRGVFSLDAIAPLDLSLTIGQPDPDAASAGALNLTNLRADHRPLAGDYGVLRPIVLHLSNPTSQSASAYLYERTTGGGGATVTLLFDGESAPTLVGCNSDPSGPRLVRAFDLAPGAIQTVAGTYMTDGASAYPIQLGLSATAPPAVPPGGCTATGITNVPQ